MTPMPHTEQQTSEQRVQEALHWIEDRPEKYQAGTYQHTLAAAVRDLTASRDAWKQRCEDAEDDADFATSQRDALTAERDRLREALEEVARQGTPGTATRAVQVAHAALNPTEQADG